MTSKRVKQTLPVRATRSTRATAINKNKEQGSIESVTNTVESTTNNATKSSSPSPKDVSKAIEALRQFDMTLRLGPCIGIKRSVRWRRAKKFGLEPPAGILEILSDTRYQNCIKNIENDLWSI